MPPLGLQNDRIIMAGEELKNHLVHLLRCSPLKHVLRCHIQAGFGHVRAVTDLLRHTERGRCQGTAAAAMGTAPRPVPRLSEPTERAGAAGGGDRLGTGGSRRDTAGISAGIAGTPPGRPRAMAGTAPSAASRQRPPQVKGSTATFPSFPGGRGGRSGAPGKRDRQGIILWAGPAP